MQHCQACIGFGGKRAKEGRCEGRKPYGFLTAKRL
jgi:hypothetical protein